MFPAFFTDVTDSYRLPRRGRLRVDLGGIYFNGLCALIAGGAYLVTRYPPLLLVVAGQQLLMLDQFIPWLRLDGYHIVSDLVGVPDLFARIRPIMAGLLPGRSPGPRVTDLKRWVGAAVTVWVLSTIVALAGMFGLIIVEGPDYLQRAWLSLHLQLAFLQYGARIGSVVDVVSGAVAIFTLLLPVAGMTFTYMLLCRALGMALARGHDRRTAVATKTTPSVIPSRPVFTRRTRRARYTIPPTCSQNAPPVLLSRNAPLPEPVSTDPVHAPADDVAAHKRVSLAALLAVLGLGLAIAPHASSHRTRRWTRRSRRAG